MAKKGKCTYCREYTDTLTKDHVFAGSWYPPNTPATVQRWTVPACEKCNNELSEVEEYLFVRWARQLDPRDPVFGEVTAKARRAIDPTATTDPREKEIRQRKRKQFHADVINVTNLDPRQTFPSLVQPASHIGIQFTKDKTDRFQDKVVRGASLRLFNRYIDPPAKIEIYNVHASDVVGGMATLDAQLTRIEIGQGFEVACGQAEDDAGLLFFRISIWGVYRFYAIVSREGFDDEGIIPGKDPVA